MNIEEKDWKEKLTPEQYAVLREKGTEAPFSGQLLHEQRSGSYRCAACGNALFASDAKFDSGTGWPSFDQAIPGSTRLVTDTSHGMQRAEVVCTMCGSHLGHMFEDGPTDSGKRYCLNSMCLAFEQEKSDTSPARIKKDL